MRVIHLTPLGQGRELSRREIRAARALVAESIRTRLMENRMRHVFARRPTPLAVLGRRFGASRRKLLVVSDGDRAAMRILLAATRPNWGLVAKALLSVARWLSRLVVMAITVTVLLAEGHGRVDARTLATTAIVVAVTTSPFLTSLRVRLGDRALAKRAATLVPELSDELGRVTVLHDLGLPRARRSVGPTTDDLAAIGSALSFGVVPTVIAQPCCVEAAELYAAWAGALLVPHHSHVERLLRIFASTSGFVAGDGLASADADIVSLHRVARARRQHPQLEPV